MSMLVNVASRRSKHTPQFSHSPHSQAMIAADRAAFMARAGLPEEFPVSARNWLTSDRAETCEFWFKDFVKMITNPDLKRASHMRNPFTADEVALRAIDGVQVLEDFQVGMPEDCIEGLSLEDAYRVQARYYNLMGMLLKEARLSRARESDSEAEPTASEPKRARVNPPEPQPEQARVNPPEPQPEQARVNSPEPEPDSESDTDPVMMGPDTDCEDDQADPAPEDGQAPPVPAPAAAEVQAPPIPVPAPEGRVVEPAPQWQPLGLKGLKVQGLLENADRMLTHVGTLQDFLSRHCVPAPSQDDANTKRSFEEAFFDITYYRSMPPQVATAFERASQELGVEVCKGPSHQYREWEFPEYGRCPILVNIK